MICELGDGQNSTVFLQKLQVLRSAVRGKNRHVFRPEPTSCLAHGAHDVGVRSKLKDEDKAVRIVEYCGRHQFC